MKTRFLIIIVFIAIFLGASFAYYNYPYLVSEIINISLSAVLTTATVGYVFLTSELVSETKKAQEALTDPRILVEVEPRYRPPPDPKRLDEFMAQLAKNPNTDLKNPRIEFCLVFRNIGSGPAYNVTPTITEQKDAEVSYPSPPIAESLRKKIQSLSNFSELSPFKSTIRYIAPNSERSFFLGDIPSDLEFQTLAPYLREQVMRIKVEYCKYPEDTRKADQKQFSVTYPIDYPYVVEWIQNILSAGSYITSEAAT